MQKIQNETVLITGASTGIGRELAELFASDGNNLILVSRNDKRLNKAKADLLSKHKVNCTAFVQDLSVPESADELVKRLSASSLGVDILINNAGIGGNGPFLETDWQWEQKMIQLNQVSLVELTKKLLPGMVKREYGKIMNVASTASFAPGPFMAVYYASKAFVLSFSQALREELKGTGVTVSTLCPGLTKTEFAKTARMDNAPIAEKGMVRNMSAKKVAQIGYKGLFKNEELIITGLQNKLAIWFMRHFPASVVIAAVSKMQQARLKNSEAKKISN